jgi:hypothetical protein
LPRIKDLAFHKIQRTEGANIIDPLAMDSFNRNDIGSRDFGYHRPCVSNKFEFFIDKNEFIKNLKNNFPNLKTPIKNKMAKKTIYFKNISKNNLKSKLTILWNIMYKNYIIINYKKYIILISIYQ